MKRFLIIALLILSLSIFSVSLTGVTYRGSDKQVTVEVKLDGEINLDDVVVESNTSGALYTIYLKDVDAGVSSMFIPIAYGPVESTRVVDITEGTMILVQLLIPRSPNVSLQGSTLLISFPISSKKIDMTFTEGSTMEVALKFLAEELNLNLIVSDSVRKLPLSLKLTQVTPEDALRNLLMTAKPDGEAVAYSYMPDGTLHIGVRSEIATRFGRFWGIYETDNGEMIQKLQTILIPGVVVNYLPDKSVLFVYGSTEEHKIISELLSVVPPTVKKELQLVVPTDKVSRLLDSLKQIYDFDYNFIEGLDKVVLTGESQAVDSVIGYVNELTAKEKELAKVIETEVATSTEPTVVTKQIKVIYPEEADAVLRDVFEVAVERLPFGYLRLTGDETVVNIAVETMEDLGFTAEALEQVQTVSLPSAHESEIIAVLMQVFGIPESRLKVVSTDDGETEIFVIAPESIRKRAISLVKYIVDSVTVAKKSRVFFLKDAELAERVGKILNEIYGIEAVSVENVLRVSAVEEDLIKAANFVNFFARDRITKILDFPLGEELAEDVKTLVKARFDVNVEANLKSLGMMILSGKDEGSLQQAVEVVEKIVSNVLTQEGVQVVRLVGVIDQISFEDIKSIVERMHEVALEGTSVCYIVSGDEKSVEEAIQTIERLRASLKRESTYVLEKISPEFDPEQISQILARVAEVEVMKVGDFLMIYGESDQVDNAEKVLQDLKEASQKAQPQEASQEIVAQVVEYEEDFPADEFQEFLISRGIAVKVSAYPKLGVAVMAGIEVQVKEALSLYEDFKEKLASAKLEEAAEEMPFVVKIIDETTVSIQATEAPLKEIIVAVSKALGIPIVFVASPQEKITMDIAKTDWKHFTEIITQNYGYSFEESDGITIVLRPQPVPDVSQQVRYVYRIPHNFEQVKALVEFYGGTAYVDDTNDLVIITGITEKVKEEVDRLVGEVSEPLKQVEIESRIVDESLVDEIVRKLSLDVELPGLNVGANSSGLNLTTSVMDLIDYQTLLSAIPSATVTASVNVTDSDSISNLLASPRIVTTSGKEARIFIGERMPYEVEDQEGNVKIMFVEPGIELRITPVVRTDGTIELTVYTKVSKSQSYPNVTVMGESTREAQTSVIVKNGSTLVIGGLIRETKEVKETKIPFLGDLPFLGQFFRTKEDDVDKRNLLIFITARVIEP